MGLRGSGCQRRLMARADETGKIDEAGRFASELNEVADLHA